MPSKIRQAATAVANTIEGIAVGTIAMFPVNSLPTGWLKANGAAISRTTYANLFAAISTTYGAGNGSTTFNVPELRGEFPRFWDDSRGIDSARAIASSQNEDFKAHLHNIGGNVLVYGGSGGNGSYAGGTVVGTAFSYNYQATTNSGGTETRPRNIALMAMIKY